MIKQDKGSDVGLEGGDMLKPERQGEGSQGASHLSRDLNKVRS